MSRKEYMEQLDMLLRDIPHTERQEALKYYEDYFEDAGTEHEADVIEELGKPEDLAKKLREDLKREENEKSMTERTGAEAEPQAGNPADGGQEAGRQEGKEQSVNGKPVNYQGADASRTKKQGKGSKALAACFIVLGILFCIGHLCRLARGIVWLVWEPAEGRFIESRTEIYEAYGSDAVQDLEIDAGFGELVIECWNEEEISVTYPQNYMEARKDGDKLLLKMSKKWGFFWQTWLGIRDDEEESYQICVKIPRGYVFREADISAGAGTASIERLEAVSMSLKTGAGEVEVEDIIVSEKIKVEAGVGETTIRNLQAAEAELSIGVGELNIRGRIDGDVSADCGVGELVVELTNRESDFNYDVSCGVGDVSVNGKDYSGIGTSHAADNGAAYDFDMSCGVGSITVTLTGVQ